MSKVQNPEAWYGKRLPKGMEWEHVWRMIDKCDDCQKMYHPNNLHSLLYPVTEADFILQKALHIEEAQSFCPDCLAAIEKEADAIDPEWRKRHGLE